MTVIVGFIPSNVVAGFLSCIGYKVLDPIPVPIPAPIPVPAPVPIPVPVPAPNPQVGSYFIEFIIIKTLFGLLFELARVWPAMQWWFATMFSDKGRWTIRSMRDAFLCHPEFLYGWIYPSIMSVSAN